MRSNDSRNRLAKVITMFLAVALGIIASGCTHRVTGGRPLSELMAPDKDGEQNYRTKSGDTLQINVWGEPKVSGDVYVREDGKFTLPLAGEIAAAGRTLEEIRIDVVARLASYIPSASVTVSVAQSAPIRYFLLGNFQKSGDYRSDGKITLLQAIAAGGGFAPFADESSLTLIRKTSQGELRYSFDYNRVVDGREPNPNLKDGDTIAVQ